MEYPPMAKYKYTPLPGSDYIRLLQLDRREDDVSTITGSLTFREKDAEEPKYMTISSSWGRNSNGYAGLTHEIFLDGRALAITENLHDLLIQLSKPTCTNQGPIWVDAVCINQADTDERSAQVSMMSIRYQRASSLTIWLGNDANEADDRQAAETLNVDQDGTGQGISAISTTSKRSHSGLPNSPKISRVQALAFQVAFVFAERYNPCAEDRFDPMPDNLANWVWPRLVRYALVGLTGREAYAYLTVHERPRLLLQEWRIAVHLSKSRLFVWREDIIDAFHESAAALGKLHQRRYFKRRWILPEIYHSQLESMMIRWGSYACRCEEFVEIGKVVGNFTEDAGIFDKVGNEWWWYLLRQVSEIFQIRDTKYDLIPRPPNLDILDLLVRFQDTKCSDDRDLFYALRGLASKEDLPAADYSLSAEETFHALAVSLVDNGQLEFVLADAALQYQLSGRSRHDGELDTSLPSWVPDLRYPIFSWSSYPRDTDGIAQASVTHNGKELTFFAKVGR